MPQCRVVKVQSILYSRALVSARFLLFVFDHVHVIFGDVADFGDPVEDLVTVVALDYYFVCAA